MDAPKTGRHVIQKTPSGLAGSGEYTLEWQKIYSFYQVVVHGSFTKGAEAVFRTQSAISQQINALEEEIGCRLFERPIRRDIKLTQAGEKVFIFAEGTIKRYEQLLGEIRATEDLHQGPLKIGSPYNVLRTVLNEKIRTYSLEYPLVEVTIYDRPPKLVLDLLHQGVIDIGTVLESICPNSLARFRWKEMDGFLITPDNHPLVKINPSNLTLEKIAEYPIISYPKDLHYTSRAFLEKMFYKSGIHYRIAMEASTIDLAVQYVKSGLGIHVTVMQSDLEGVDQTGLSFVPLSHLFERDHLNLVVRNLDSLLPYQIKFIESLLGAKI